MSDMKNAGLMPQDELAKVERTKVTDLDIIVTMIDGKPYYGVKYKELGNANYTIGYSSYNLDIVLGYVERYFEPTETRTNSDRIRSMTDEELADWLHNIDAYTGDDDEPYASMYNLDTEKTEEVYDSYGDLLDWLKEEHNVKKQNE